MKIDINSFIEGIKYAEEIVCQNTINSITVIIGEKKLSERQLIEIAEEFEGLFKQIKSKEHEKIMTYHINSLEK